MASYLDEYKALDTVPKQKAQSYEFLTANRDKLNLTQDEEYKFNWGDEALSEDWINGKVAEIQKSVEDANSTNILRRGLGEGDVAKTPEQEASAAAKGLSGAKGERSDRQGGYKGPSGEGNSDGEPSSDAGMPGGLSSLSMTTQAGLADAAKGAALGFATAGPIGAIVNGIKSYFGGEAKQVARENAATETRQLTRMNEVAEAQRAADAQAAHDAATEAAQTHAAAVAAANAQSGSNRGATSNSSGNGSPGHNNAGSTRGSDRGEGGGPSSSSRSGL
jgi:hypothetical protein